MHSKITAAMPFIALTVLSAGCLDLDSFAHNPRHCSKVGPDTCENKEEYWDKICVPCDAPYDFGQDYNWFDETFKAGESIRALPNSSVENFKIKTSDGEGELDAYFITGHGDNPKTANTTVLFNHGNFGGIEHYIPRLRYMYEGGYNIFVWDYRGYGKSLPDTIPTPAQWAEDSVLIRDWVETSTVIPDKSKLVVYSNSLGANASLDMVRHKPGCALIQEAGFVSLSSVARTDGKVSLPENYLSNAFYNNAEEIKSYSGPLFVMIGTEDVRYSTEEMRALYDNSPSTAKEYWELEGVHHGISDIGIPEAGLFEYLARTEKFLETHAPACFN